MSIDFLTCETWKWNFICNTQLLVGVSCDDMIIDKH